MLIFFAGCFPANGKNMGVLGTLVWSLQCIDMLLND